MLLSHLEKVEGYEISQAKKTQCAIYLMSRLEILPAKFAFCTLLSRLCTAYISTALICLIG